MPLPDTVIPPPTCAVSTCVVPILRRFCLQNRHVKPIEQIHTYDAEDVFEFLNSRDHAITRDNVTAFRKESSHEVVEEPESQPSERTTTVLKWTDGLGLIVAGIEVSEDSDGKEQGAATAGLGIVRVLAAYEEVLKEDKSFLSDQTSLLDLSHFQGLFHRHLYFWTLGRMNKMNCQQFRRKCSLLKSSFCLAFHIFFINFFVIV